MLFFLHGFLCISLRNNLKILIFEFFIIQCDTGPRDSRSLPLSNRLGSRSVSQDSVYTILIRLPPDGGSGDERGEFQNIKLYNHFIFE